MRYLRQVRALERYEAVERLLDQKAGLSETVRRQRRNSTPELCTNRLLCAPTVNVTTKACFLLAFCCTRAIVGSARRPMPYALTAHSLKLKCRNRVRSRLAIPFHSTIGSKYKYNSV